MILIALLLICIVVLAIVWSKKRGLTVSPSSPRLVDAQSQTESSVPGYVEALLQRWTGAGLITAELADAVRAFERSTNVGEVQRVDKRTNVHKIAEALGYLGGVLGIVGVVVLLAQFWDDFSDVVRLVVPSVSTAVLIVAGFIVPELRSPQLLRLRTFFWSLATIASGISAWVLSEVVFDVTEIRRHWLFVGAATTIVSFALWGGRKRPVQQFSGLAAVAVVVGTGIGEFASAGFSGLGVWAAGAILLITTLHGTDLRAGVNHLVGSMAVVVGSYLTTIDWMGPGSIFVLMTGLALVSPASIRRVEMSSPTPLILGIVGLLALVQGVPMTLVHFANEAGLATGLILWSAGLATIALVGRTVLRMNLVFLLLSGIMIVGGAAITGVQFVGFSTLFGLATSVALIAYGARPGRALMSVFGLVGVMVFIPWMIAHFFPGEGRVPVLIIVSGLLLVVVAVVLTRVGGRLRGEMRTSE